MPNGITRQTPRQTREWLAREVKVFPENWTLDDVADECHRMFLADRWPGGELQAARAVVTWATEKLAKCSYFTAEHWNWIAAKDKFDRTDGYSRLQDILRPAVAANPAWKKTQDERKNLLTEIDKAAEYLLKILETSMRFDVSLRNVAGLYPRMKPLLDHSSKLQDTEFERFMEPARKARESGASMAGIVAASLIGGDGYLEPRLSDYLRTLRASIRGTLGIGQYETDEGKIWGEIEVPESHDLETLNKRSGVSFKKIDAIDALGTGGDFGSYPARKDALRRSVIAAFPAAIFDRFTSPPRCTPASVIESACIAWFGSAPTSKEINAAIKPVRGKLENSMKLSINALKKQDHRLARWRSQGLSENEMKRETLKSFLEDD